MDVILGELSLALSSFGHVTMVMRGGSLWRPIISWEPAWMWHVLFKRAIVWMLIYVLHFIATSFMPWTRGGWQTFKESIHLIKAPHWRFVYRVFVLVGAALQDSLIVTFFHLLFFLFSLSDWKKPTLSPPRGRSTHTTESNHKTALFPIPSWSACWVHKLLFCSFYFLFLLSLTELLEVGADGKVVARGKISQEGIGGHHAEGEAVQPRCLMSSISDQHQWLFYFD